MKRIESSLVISLDFELLWGVFDKVDYQQKQDYFLNTRKLIPQLIQLFEQYDIHATWATVGMLFNENWEEWIANIPKRLPVYENQKLSAYKYASNNKHAINDELCFAHNLIDQLASSKWQEVGTHTYSHYYCLEPGQDKISFQDDLETAFKLARQRNLDIKTLVFPRNQINKEYLEVCKTLGVTSVRSNPENWYWQNTQNDSLQQKIFRTGDAYMGLYDKSYSLMEIVQNNLPIQQKASRLLRPREGKMRNKLKLNRIFNEIENAARHGKIYHLWWHPHNFGNDPQGNMDDLKLILDQYLKCRNDFGMQSKNMGEIADLVYGF